MHNTNTSDQTTFGKRIRSAREARGLTRVKVGILLYVSDATVRNWEYDKNFPGFEFLDPLSQVLGISVHYMLTGVEYSDPLAVVA